MEWFGQRSYFDQRDRSSQAMWMDMALARQSGQELVNHYVITNSPASANIRRFFHASIRHLTATYQRIAAEQTLQDIKPSIGDQMHHNFSAVDSIKEEIDPQMNEASGYTPTASDIDVRSPVVVTPRRSSTRLQSRESPVVGSTTPVVNSGYVRGFPGCGYATPVVQPAQPCTGSDGGQCDGTSPLLRAHSEGGGEFHVDSQH